MKKALLFFGMFISMLSVNAADNVLQSIEIVPVKDTYNIVLVADKSVDVKKTVKAPNQVVLEMKDINLMDKQYKQQQELYQKTQICLEQ